MKRAFFSLLQDILNIEWYNLRSEINKFNKLNEFK